MCCILYQESDQSAVQLARQGETPRAVLTAVFEESGGGSNGSAGGQTNLNLHRLLSTVENNQEGNMPQVLQVNQRTKNVDTDPDDRRMSSVPNEIK